MLDFLLSPYRLLLQKPERVMSDLLLRYGSLLTLQNCAEPLLFPDKLFIFPNLKEKLRIYWRKFATIINFPT